VAAHAAGNKAFVYIAGLECITAHADKTAHSLFRDHPDWVQRQLNGTPAVFGGGVAFWVAPGDEDVAKRKVLPDSESNVEVSFETKTRVPIYTFCRFWGKPRRFPRAAAVEDSSPGFPDSAVP